MFEHGVALARGTDDLRAAPAPTVPAESLEAAGAIAEEVHDFVLSLRMRFNEVQWPMLGRTPAIVVLGAAQDGAKSLVIATQERLGSRGRNQPPIQALGGGRIVLAVQEMRLAREFMEIIAGERTVETSVLSGADEWAEIYLGLVPVLGEAMIIYEALVGESVITRRKLSHAERAMNGLALVLPTILSHVAAPVLRTASNVGRITRRGVEIALEYRRVYRLLETVKRIPHAMQIAIGLRRLPEAEFREFLVLMGRISRGDALTEVELARTTFFFCRMSEDAIAGLWLKIAHDSLGSSLQGFQRLPGSKFQQHELELFEGASKLSKEPMIGLPKDIMPIDYPRPARFAANVKNVRYADTVWGEGLMDGVSLQATTVDGAVSAIGKKAGQAPTVLVGFAEGCPLRPADIERALPRLFGNARLATIDRIVVYDGARLFEHFRQPFYLPKFMLGLAAPRATGGKKLLELVDELEAEPRPRSE